MTQFELNNLEKTYMSATRHIKLDFTKKKATKI